MVFDHRRGELTRCDAFSDASKALRAYSAEEREHERDDFLEIVLVGSDSIETVRRTHSNYFDTTVQSEYLAGL
jgi:hypothetical protein